MEQLGDASTKGRAAHVKDAQSAERLGDGAQALDGLVTGGFRIIRNVPGLDGNDGEHGHRVYR